MGPLKQALAYSTDSQAEQWRSTGRAPHRSAAEGRARSSWRATRRAAGGGRATARSAGRPRTPTRCRSPAAACRPRAPRRLCSSAALAAPAAARASLHPEQRARRIDDVSKAKPDLAETATAERDALSDNVFKEDNGDSWTLSEDLQFDLILIQIMWDWFADC